MFVRLFSSILESSLMETNVNARWLFVTMLIIGDEGRDGVVDMPVSRLAAKAGMSIEDTEAALAELMAPDPDSHSPDHGGARLVPLYEDKPNRGWVIVNWAKYKKIAREEARKEQARKDSKAYYDRMKELGSQISSGDSQCLQTTESESKTDTEPLRRKRERFAPPSLEEVIEYVKTQGYRFDPVAFHAFYESVGWKVGNKPMKSWHSACVTWEKRFEPEGHVAQGKKTLPSGDRRLASGGFAAGDDSWFDYRGDRYFSEPGRPGVYRTADGYAPDGSHKSTTPYTEISRQIAERILKAGRS